jgi:ribosome-associated protein
VTEDLRVSRGLEIPAGELREAASRSSGPGGQHVNKTNTRVTLRWNIQASEALSDRQRARLLTRLAHRLTGRSDLIVHADQARSRTRNRERALLRLAAIVREGLSVQRSRVATKPSKGARKRRVETKRRRSTLKGQRKRPSGDE